MEYKYAFFCRLCISMLLVFSTLSYSNWMGIRSCYHLTAHKMHIFTLATGVGKFPELRWSTNRPQEGGVFSHTQMRWCTKMRIASSSSNKTPSYIHTNLSPSPKAPRENTHCDTRTTCRHTHTNSHRMPLWAATILVVVASTLVAIRWKPAVPPPSSYHHYIEAIHFGCGVVHISPRYVNIYIYINVCVHRACQTQTWRSVDMSMNMPFAHSRILSQRRQASMFNASGLGAAIGGVCV